MMLSIITVNLNNREGLMRTLTSLKSQTFIDFEHIILDGESTDGSLDLIKNYNATNSQWISESDSGIYEAMNKGIKMAKGEYLLFLNSGDVLINNNILQEVASKIKDKDIYYGDKINLDQRGQQHFIDFPDQLSFQYFYDGGYLPHCSAFIKKDLFDRVFYYNENLKIVADWEFFVVAICKHNASYEHWSLPIAIFEYGGLSQDPDIKNKKNLEGANILSHHFPLFVKDYDKFKNYEKLFKYNRFQNLERLEYSVNARKLNTLWFKFMRMLFK